MTLGHGRFLARSIARVRAVDPRAAGFPARSGAGLSGLLCALVLLAGAVRGATAQVGPSGAGAPASADSTANLAASDSAAAAIVAVTDSAEEGSGEAGSPAVSPPPEEPAPAAREAAGGSEQSPPAAEQRPPEPQGPVAAPATLNDLDAWLEYKTRSHLLALPQEARLFFRRGLMVRASGGRTEALRLVRGAARLDPGFVAPRLTLAGWLAVTAPGEALEQCGRVLDLARASFMIQLVVAANALYLGIQALFLALLAAALVVVMLNQDRLRHGLAERLAPFLTRETAGWWSWAMLLAPYLAGVGPALPTVLFLGLLWPTGKLRERTLFVLLSVTLAGVPLLTAALDRLSSPLQGDRAPFYGVPELQAEPYSAERRAEIEGRATAHPENPFLSFAAAWMAQRGGNPRAAEARYRRALESWPGDDRVLNNLGNTLAAQGRGDDALEAYRDAATVNPRNAAAHFNASQIYTQRYDFHAANEELARASAADFELVRTYQGERAEAKWAVLVDQWIAPAAFWRSLREVPFSTTASGALPPLWRTRIECSGWTFSLVALALAAGSLALGLLFHRSIPVRGCSNCGRGVCRRCAERHREMALCPACATIWSRAENPDFGRVLLFQHHRRLRQHRAMVARVVGMLLPGFGYLPHRKLLRPVLLLGATAALLSLSLGIATPFTYEPRFAVPGHDVPLAGLVISWLALYAVSIPTYLSFEKRAREKAALVAPTRTRVMSAPRRPTQAAA